MNPAENLARIILRPDGSVHTAFQDCRSIFSTATNLSELFANPIEFIKTKSYTYEESTFEINRKRVVLDEVLGLTLASINSDKQIICDFPELFQFIFNIPTEAKTQHLNMKSFELETVLSDEKSYLLRYYLEFTSKLTSTLSIKNNIKLRNEIQSEIIREILNTFFMDTLPEAPKEKDVTSQINLAENTVLFEAKSQPKMVGVVEYSNQWGLSPQTVRLYIKQNRIKSVTKTSRGAFLIDINEKPIDWDLRKDRKRKPTNESKYYRRRSKGSAEEVKQHILKLDLFSEKIAPYIHTYEELDYYTSHNYHEVCWDGQSALIIDINPDYISNAGIKNRDLLAAGKSPHIPNREKDEYTFHIHHIGQHSTSPFAIIPEYEHNAAGYSSFFHQGSPKEDLHTPEFEALKINFWRNYLKKYDESGSFAKIPFSNHRNKRNIK